MWSWLNYHLTTHIYHLNFWDNHVMLSRCNLRVFIIFYFCLFSCIFCFDILIKSFVTCLRHYAIKTWMQQMYLVDGIWHGNELVSTNSHWFPHVVIISERWEKILDWFSEEIVLLGACQSHVLCKWLLKVAVAAKCTCRLMAGWGHSQNVMFSGTQLLAMLHSHCDEPLVRLCSPSLLSLQLHAGHTNTDKVKQK